MRVYNLTDQTPPGRKQRTPRDLKVFGKVVAPGKFEEFPDNKSLGSISGWIYSKQVCIDAVPDWYIKARREFMADRIKTNLAAVAPPPTPVEEESKEEPEKEEVSEISSTTKKRKKTKKRE